MHSTYRLRADELSSTLLNAIKNTYRDREIEITVQEVQDETDYLMSSPANREHLLKAIENISKHRDLVSVNPDEL
jgi:antitoxin YefM